MYSTILRVTPFAARVFFAISRISGWCAHRIEELVSGGRIYRPAYKNVSKERPYVPIKER